MRNALETRLLVRVVAAIGALCAAVTVQAGIKSARQIDAIMRNTPAAQVVAEGQQMRQAELAATVIKGAQIFWGVGQSMQPLYAPSTAVVVRPIEYGRIKKGMTLLYTRRDGAVVAHSVVDEDGQGYVVQGVNNDEPDRESVNETNLIGVVVAAYSANESEFRNNLARSLVNKGKVTLVAGNS